MKLGGNKEERFPGVWKKRGEKKCLCAVCCVSQCFSMDLDNSLTQTPSGKDCLQIHHFKKLYFSFFCVWKCIPVSSPWIQHLLRETKLNSLSYLSEGQKTLRTGVFSHYVKPLSPPGPSLHLFTSHSLSQWLINCTVTPSSVSWALQKNWWIKQLN